MIEPGTLVGNYRIIELLASGGMGEVYVAEDTKLERRIALKVLPDDMACDPERLERFAREARVVASLNHPNIVTIHSVEEAERPDGQALHFITMELVEGRTLDKEIPHGGLAIDRFFAVAVPLAAAVGAAHQKGITHRDLKPGNVMLTTDGRLKVLDFGLAKLAEDPSARLATDPAAATAATAVAPITEEGKVLGTVAYMSPEQAEGKPVDNRSDIFSLGIILYEMVTGELPFKGGTKMSLMSSIIKDSPVSVTEIKRELPNHLGRIIKRCLEKDPERRLQSAVDVRNDLAGLKEEIDSGEVVTTQSAIDARHAAPVSAAPANVASAASASAHAPEPVSAPPHAPGSNVPTGAVPSTPLPAASAGGWPRNRLAIAGVAVAAVALVVVGWLMFGGGGDSTRAVRGSDTALAAGGPLADTRPSVAVLYFDNLSGDPSLDWLRGGLTELLVTDLSQSPELRVTTTDALYEILDETGNLETRVTSAALVRAVAERADVDHVVVGSFIRAGDTFRLSARLQEAASGDVIAAETVEGPGEDSVFASVDALTRRIKDRLSVPVSATAVVDRDLSDVTTSSMDAYRHYTDGVNLISQNRYAEAVPEFERAVEIDPEFAMAFAKLSIVHGNMFDNDTARSFSAKAIEHADRLTQRERFYIEGRYYSQDDETTPQSIAAYENALALYPDDSASRNNVALEYSELEQYDRSVAHFEELLRRGSPFLPAYFNAAMAYVSNGECDRGFGLIRDFVRQQADYHFGYADLATIAMYCGRLDEAWAALGTYEESVDAGQPSDVFFGSIRYDLHVIVEEFDEALAANELLAQSSSPTARYVAYPLNRMRVAAYRGQYREALAAAVEVAASLPDDASEKADLWASIALHQLRIGNIEQALQAAEEAGSLAQDLDDNIFIAGLTAVAQARAGRSVAARTAAQQQERLGAQLAHPWARRDELMVAAEMAMAQGDTTTAVDRLTEASELLPPGPTFPVFDPLVEHSYALAEAQLAAGNPVAAAELFRTVTESGSRRIHRPFEYVRSFYFLGKIAEDDGDTAAARRYYERFLGFWGDGEIDRDKVEAARSFINGD